LGGIGDSFLHGIASFFAIIYVLMIPKERGCEGQRLMTHVKTLVFNPLLLQSSLHDPYCDTSTSMPVPKHGNSIVHHELSYAEYWIQDLDTNFDEQTWVEFIKFLIARHFWVPPQMYT
jgi:hypothetical protein